MPRHLLIVIFAVLLVVAASANISAQTLLWRADGYYQYGYLATDASGSIYVQNISNYNISKLSSNGDTAWTIFGGYPHGFIQTTVGVYIVYTDSIRHLDPDGNSWSYSLTGLSFGYAPCGESDGDGNLYIGAKTTDAVYVMKFSQAGTLLFQTALPPPTLKGTVYAFPPFGPKILTDGSIMAIETWGAYINKTKPDGYANSTSHTMYSFVLNAANGAIQLQKKVEKIAYSASTQKGSDNTYANIQSPNPFLSNPIASNGGLTVCGTYRSQKSSTKSGFYTSSQLSNWEINTFSTAGKVKLVKYKGKGTYSNKTSTSKNTGDNGLNSINAACAGENADIVYIGGGIFSGKLVDGVGTNRIDGVVMKYDAVTKKIVWTVPLIANSVSSLRTIGSRLIAAGYSTHIANVYTFDGLATPLLLNFSDALVSLPPYASTDTTTFLAFMYDGASQSYLAKFSMPASSSPGTSKQFSDLPQEVIPAAFALEQNYPNPFNPTTMIKFSLPENAQVKLAVFNMLGQEVALLVDEARNAGTYSVEWNAANNPSGTYMCRLTAGTNTEMRKIVLLR